MRECSQLTPACSGAGLLKIHSGSFPLIISPDVGVRSKPSIVRDGSEICRSRTGRLSIASVYIIYALAACSCPSVSVSLTGSCSHFKHWFTTSVLPPNAGKRCSESNSKHWFTTSSLQPLPYLVTPLGPGNCQLTSSFLFVLRQY